MADDVDGQKKVTIAELSKISPHARDLARGTGEEDTSTGAERIPHAPVDLGADGGLDILRAHDRVHSGGVPNEDVPHGAAAFVERSATYDTAPSEYVTCEQAEDAARR